jgi:glycosidase
LAANTPLSYRNLVLYEIYVRGHGPNGTFADVEADLERIRAMGVDAIWLMPIHPIGKVNRKGPLGSPYSISDYPGKLPD